MGNPIVYTPGSIEVQQTRIKEGNFMEATLMSTDP